ncbi:MAG: metal ABC transporter permease [Trueperaceae bacterium]
MIEWLVAPFRYGFMLTALAAAVLVGISCAAIGVHVVLRRMAFSGEALAHSVLPGLVVAYLTGASLSFGAMIAGVTAALGIGWLTARERLREDTAIGIIFTAMFALGVLLASSAGSYRDLSHMLFGNLLGVTVQSLWLIAGMTAVVLLALVLLHKEFALTSFDATHAAVIGLPAAGLRYVLLLLIAGAVIIGVQAVGVVLVTALLVTPAAAASLLTDKLPRMMPIACAIAVATAVSGLYASYYANVVSGPAVVLACAFLFLLAWLYVVVAGKRTHSPGEPETY